MKQINYKSDFEFILCLKDCRGVDMGLPDYDWEAILYTTSPNNGYVVSYKNGQCTNWYVDEGRIHIVVDNHGMQPGTLHIEWNAKIPNGYFPDGDEKIVSPLAVDIELIRGAAPCSPYADVALVLPYIKGDKGDPFTYDDFTPEQIADLKRPATEAAAQVYEAIEKAEVTNTAIIEAEEQRNIAEQERVAAEQQRETAEAQRVDNAVDFAEAENKRVIAEEQRVQAEYDRQHAYGGLLTVDAAKETYQTKDEAKAETERVNSEIAKKEDKFTLGYGLKMSEQRELSVTIDTTLFKVISELPERPDKGDENKIFLVPAETTSEEDVYAEYLWANGRWEKFGEVIPEVDLSDYYTKEKVDKLLSDKVSNEEFGKGAPRLSQTYKIYGNDFDGSHDVSGQIQVGGIISTGYGEFSIHAFEDPFPGHQSPIKVNGPIYQNNGDVELATTAGSVGIGLGKGSGHFTQGEKLHVGGHIIADGNVLGQNITELTTDVEEIKEQQESDLQQITTIAGKLNGITNLSEELDKKADKFTAGYGLKMSPENELSVNLDLGVYKVVEVLPDKPAQGDENKIHLVLSDNKGDKNVYKEYLYVNGAWELLGEYKADIDLTPYLKKEDAEKTYLNKTEGATKKELETLEFTLETINQGLGEAEQDIQDLQGRAVPTNGKDGQILISSKGKGVWADLEILDILDLITYGVEWKPTVADPALTRIGNMNFHRTLPIQSAMKGCIYNPLEKKVVYWLDDSDWRYRQNPIETTLNAIASDISFLYVDKKILQLTEEKEDNVNFYADRYAVVDGVNGLWQFTRGEAGGGYVVYELEYLGSDNWDSVQTKVKATTKIFLHTIFNGYDGEVMVYVPEFYIKSWDKPDIRQVRISTNRIDETWQHQPAVYIGAYRDTVLNTAVENMGYLSTLQANTAVSVANNKAYCRGGDNSSANDNNADIFKRNLGKPRTNITRADFRANARKAGKEIMSYRQYKNILYWLWVIEYATFNSQAPFNPNLTTEGCHQGGMGNGLTNLSNWNDYNELHPIHPNGYTNEFGNETNIKLIAPDGPDPIGNVYATRWRGIENIFGDVWHNVDGIIINSSTINRDGVVYSEVYTTDNPELYSDSNWQAMEKIAEEYNNDNGWIKEWDLGSTAEIIPRSHGGNATQYKCDYHSIKNSKELRIPIIGGSSSTSANAGLGCNYSSHPVNYLHVYIGFRTSCVVDTENK